MALFALGDLYYTLVLEKLDDPPFPAPADAGHVCIHPFAYVGLVLMVRALTRPVPLGIWVDGLVAALPFGGSAGAHFDPRVVEAFCSSLADSGTPELAGALG